MQPTRPGENHSLAWLNRDFAVSFFVEVRELAAQGGMDVANPEFEMLPEIRHRVFEVEHHSRRSGVQHLHHQLGIVGRAGHLVALVLAPLGHDDRPIRRGRLGRRQVIRRPALMRLLEHALALGHQLTLTRRESLMQRKKEVQEPGGQIALQVESSGAELMENPWSCSMSMKTLAGVRPGRKMAFRSLVVRAALPYDGLQDFISRPGWQKFPLESCLC